MSALDHWLDRRAVAIAARDEVSSPPRRASGPPVFNGVSRSRVFTDMVRFGADRLPDPPDRLPATLPAHDRRLTRSTALKGAAALLVLVGLPAARPAPAKAQERFCSEKCLEQYQRALLLRLDECFVRYRFSSYNPGRTLDFLFGNPAAKIPMKVLCDAWVVRSAQSEVNKCFDMCEAQDNPAPPKPPDPVCGSGTPKLIGKEGDCASFPPPPPTLDPSDLPPPQDDGCANCASVGGKCCGSSTPSQYICACANPGSDCCAVYSCC